jgi:hypothetical protein
LIAEIASQKVGSTEAYVADLLLFDTRIESRERNAVRKAAEQKRRDLIKKVRKRNTAAILKDGASAARLIGPAIDHNSRPVHAGGLLSAGWLSIQDFVRRHRQEPVDHILSGDLSVPT